MKINKKKTEVMMFTTSRKFDFPPELKFADQTNVQVTCERSLFGVVIIDDLKWKRNK